jgi:cyanophycinase
MKKGWKDVKVVHANDRQAAMQDGFGGALQEAQAVWIGGGDQSRLSHRYCGTEFLQRLLDWFHRGGVLGGTSAGAAVMSARMIAGGVDEPQFGEGFGVLPTVIIDQHFAQKNRIARLTKAVAQSKDVLGVGIDECTGWLIEGAATKVIGAGSIHVVERSGAISMYQAGELPLSIR